MEIQRNEIVEFLNSETKDFNLLFRLISEYLVEINKSSTDILEFIKNNPGVMKMCYNKVVTHYSKKFNISYIITKDGRILLYF